MDDKMYSITTLCIVLHTQRVYIHRDKKKSKQLIGEIELCHVDHHLHSETNRWIFSRRAINYYVPKEMLQWKRFIVAFLILNHFPCSELLHNKQGWRLLMLLEYFSAWWTRSFYSLKTVIIIFCTLCTESIIPIRPKSSSRAFQVTENNRSTAAWRGAFFNGAISRATYMLVTQTISSRHIISRTTICLRSPGNTSQCHS